MMENANMINKLDKMGAELDSYKIKLIENETKAKREFYERQQIANSRVVKTKFRPLRFIGEAKSFQEILNMMNGLDQLPLNNKERQISLEEFCIYGELDEDNVDKLRALGGARHASKSIMATDTTVVIRALVFASLLAKDDEKSCQILVENGAITSLLEYLNSNNENFRVETLFVLEEISRYPLIAKLFREH
jgi:hypothetical protein